jgi:hypothetical protein
MPRQGHYPAAVRYLVASTFLFCKYFVVHYPMSITLKEFSTENKNNIFILHPVSHFHLEGQPRHLNGDSKSKDVYT